MGIALVMVKRYRRASVLQAWQAVWRRKEYQEMSLEKQVRADVEEWKTMLRS